MTPNAHHLPLSPPAFPSGIPGGISEAPLPDDAVTPPDARVVRDGPVRIPDDFELVMLPREDGADDEAIRVTGIGAEDAVAGSGEAILNPYLERVVTELEALVGALRRKGEAGLRMEPGMTRFETTLRGYCVGYLAALDDSALEATHQHDFD